MCIAKIVRPPVEVLVTFLYYFIILIRVFVSHRIWILLGRVVFFHRSVHTFFTLLSMRSQIVLRNLARAEVCLNGSEKVRSVDFQIASKMDCEVVLRADF